MLCLILSFNNFVIVCNFLPRVIEFRNLAVNEMCSNEKCVQSCLLGCTAV
jgi:hypothetical protein